MTIRHRFRMIPVLLAAAALSLAACGDDSGDSKVATLDNGSASSAPSAAPSGDLDKQLNDYLECLRKQGLNVPDATVDAKGRISFGTPAAGQSFDRDKFTDAQKVCGDLPAGLTTGLEDLDQSELQDAALAFAKCMRGQGVEMADPDVSKLGQGGGAFADLDRDDPKVAAAVESCQHVFADAGIIRPGGGS
jgi:hypothetical protein